MVELFSYFMILKRENVTLKAEPNRLLPAMNLVSMQQSGNFWKPAVSSAIFSFFDLFLSTAVLEFTITGLMF